MNLDEAILHAIEKSKSLLNCECAKEHKQLSEWLIELKKKKGRFKMNYTVHFEGSSNSIRTKKYFKFSTKKEAIDFGKQLRKENDNSQCMVLVIKDCPEEITVINYTGYKHRN